MWHLKCFYWLCIPGFLSAGSLDMSFETAFGETLELNDEEHSKATAEAEARAQTRKETHESMPPDDTHYFNSLSARHSVLQGSNDFSSFNDEQQSLFELIIQILKEKNFSDEDIKKAGEKSIQCDKDKIKCDETYPYRTYNGSCNNFEHPQWGMEGYCFNRIMRPHYADGYNSLRKSVTGKELPTPRTVSLKIHGHINAPSRVYPQMFIQWGQFMDHDFSLSPASTRPDGKPLKCCPEIPNEPQCGAIKIKKDDPFYSQYNVTCIDNARTQRCKTCSYGPREQAKLRTSYIDASTVYGSDDETAKKIRTMKGGRLKSYEDKKVGELLPRVPPTDDCKEDSEKRCFVAGESRVNQHPALTVMHTMFLRLHNKIVKELEKLNPQWDDERLYQETRRIVGAIMQVITFKEYLALIIGLPAMEEFQLVVGDDTHYNPYVNPTIINEFATAAFRFGHTVVSGDFRMVYDEGNSESYELRNNYFWPFSLYYGGLLWIAKGLLIENSQKFDRYVTKDVTNHLYRVRGHCYGADLASFNVFRGRDHGMPPYVDVVRFCGGPDIRSFEDLERFGLFKKGMARLFASVYDNVRDIDFFSGGITEVQMKDIAVSHTFQCIITRQFFNMKFGDRFYFEHVHEVGSFTPAQRNELRKMTLGKVMCAVLHLNYTQENVFLLSGPKNPDLPCYTQRFMDLHHWLEFDFDFDHHKPYGHEAPPHEGGPNSASATA